jgi:caffeoyl-CoA O-methyltransferase
MGSPPGSFSYLCGKLAGMEMISPEAQAYSARYSTAEGELLEQIATYTVDNHPQAQMLSGHVQGKFLEMISRLLRPRRVLEIGTFMGYSALCLAAGLTGDGRLHTIELREDDAAIAAENFKRANWQDRIILHVGNALEIIPSLKEEWDLVFIDADKVNYSAYYRLVLPGLRSGGLIIADNVLFHGEVLEKEVKGKNALAIQEFNKLVGADDSVDKVMLTVRDGLFLVRKK